jgi:catechol 2,3-dioxygenase-like lactoylglutathione lyase family enzyme
MKIRLVLIALIALVHLPLHAAAPVTAEITPPDTGISGVFEVMLGARDEKAPLTHFAQFGFKEVARAKLDAKQALALYGVDSALESIRLQNGSIDSHGLLRVLVWQKPIGDGVGYAPPETVGQRLSVLMVRDIVRLDDVFNDARRAGQPWLPIAPVFADLFGQTEGKPDFFNRKIGVREAGVYGELLNHVFFQRYGYTIPGYGTINSAAPLAASEFTHHDFIIKTDITQATDYYRDVLGFKAENNGAIDGDWLEGPKKVFGMVDGGSHYYRGFVSPNNICGKLKFFRPRDIRTDRSSEQKIGALGVTLHSLYSTHFDALFQSARRAGLQPKAAQKNEFGERSFLFVGPDGVAWQILDAATIKNGVQNVPVKVLEIKKTAD